MNALRCAVRVRGPPGRAPEYGGAAPMFWATVAGEAETAPRLPPGRAPKEDAHDESAPGGHPVAVVAAGTGSAPLGPRGVRPRPPRPRCPPPPPPAAPGADRAVPARVRGRTRGATPPRAGGAVHDPVAGIGPGASDHDPDGRGHDGPGPAYRPVAGARVRHPRYRAAQQLSVAGQGVEPARFAGPRRHRAEWPVHAG